MKKFGYKTVMVPRITKITLIMGVGEAVNDTRSLLNTPSASRTKIAGQNHRYAHP